MIGRTLSLIIATLYITLMYISGDWEALLWTVINLVFVLALIWFGDDLADYGVGLGIGGHGAGRIDESSHPFFIKFMGWILLLLPILLIPLAYLVVAP